MQKLKKDRKNESIKNSVITVQVEKFPVVKPKIAKNSWDSGEGQGEGA